jgi:hypothetical protein
LLTSSISCSIPGILETRKKLSFALTNVSNHIIVFRAIGIRFGNHVGDWEHQMIRFVNGTPANVYLSAHSSGTAYTFAALPKASGTQRPITYIAKGTHANYATAGRQPYPIPVIGPIADSTSKGFLWDMTKNYRGYWFDNTTKSFPVAGGAGSGGDAQAAGETASWLNFLGRWGNDTPDDSEGDQFAFPPSVITLLALRVCHIVFSPCCTLLILV